MYILFMVLSLILRFFLKFKKEKYCKILLKIYFIVVFILFIDKLNSCCWVVKVVFLNGFCRWIFNGYVGLLYKYRGWLVGVI